MNIPSPSPAVLSPPPALAGEPRGVDGNIHTNWLGKIYLFRTTLFRLSTQLTRLIPTIRAATTDERSGLPLRGPRARGPGGAHGHAARGPRRTCAGRPRTRARRAVDNESSARLYTCTNGLPIAHTGTYLSTYLTTFTHILLVPRPRSFTTNPPCAPSTHHRAMHLPCTNRQRPQICERSPTPGLNLVRWRAW